MPLVAVRHAETVWNRERVFMGGLDVAPAPDGLARASALSLPADRVFTSPLRRATCTAAALFPELRAVADDRLRERGMGEWEGRGKDEVRREHPEAFPGGHLDVTLTPPGGESLDDLVARVAAFLDDVAPLARASDVVVVTHNGWIRAAQYLAGEAVLAAFHATPAPHLVPTVLRVPVRRAPIMASGRAR
jgi:broad specificity phosphatase PhoE